MVMVGGWIFFFFFSLPGGEKRFSRLRGNTFSHSTLVVGFVGGQQLSQKRNAARLGDMIRCPRFLVVTCSGQLSQFSSFVFSFRLEFFLCMHTCTCSLYLIYILHVFVPYRYHTCHLFLCLNSTRAPCLSGERRGNNPLRPLSAYCPSTHDAYLSRLPRLGYRQPCKRPPTHHDPPQDDLPADLAIPSIEVE